MIDPDTLSGLITRFDAGTIAQSDNTAVASWAPAAGPETAAAAQGTAGQRPTFRTNRINGRPAVVFAAASSQCLDTGAWGSSYATPNMALVVAKLTNGGTGSAANLFTGRAGILNYIGQENAFVQIGAGAGNQLTLAHAPDSAFHIFAAAYNSGSSAIYLDSITAGATGSTGTGTGNDNMPGMRIGSTSSGGGNFPDGEIAEIVFYDRVLTVNEFVGVMRWLNYKYALGANVGSDPIPPIVSQYGSTF